MYGGAIDWRASKQKTVTTSSTEAEFLAISEAGKSLQWWKRFFAAIDFDPHHELGIKCDNKQTIRILTREDPTVQSRLRHVDIHQHWLHSTTCDSILNTDLALSEGYVVQKLREHEKRLQSKGKEAAHRATRNGNCFKCDKPGHIAINCRSNRRGPGQAESGPSEQGSRSRPNRRPRDQGEGTC